jgi:hypothetical protein
MSNQNGRYPTPEEWKVATDYALTLGDKMLKASEQRSEENKCEAPKASPKPPTK